MIMKPTANSLSGKETCDTLRYCLFVILFFYFIQLKDFWKTCFSIPKQWTESSVFFRLVSFFINFEIFHFMDLVRDLWKWHQGTFVRKLISAVIIKVILCTNHEIWIPNRSPLKHFLAIPEVLREKICLKQYISVIGIPIFTQYLLYNAY